MMLNTTETEIDLLLEKIDISVEIGPTFVQDAFKVFYGDMEYGDWHRKYSLKSIKGSSVEELVLLQINDVLNFHGLEDIESPLAPDQLAATYLNAGNTYSTTVLYDRIWNRLLITTMGDYVELIQSLEGMVKNIYSKFEAEVESDWEIWEDSETAKWEYPIALCDRDSYLELYLGTSVKALTSSNALYAIGGIGSATALGMMPEVEDQSSQDDVVELIVDLYRQILTRKNSGHQQSSSS